jgi:NADPH:quinone reductase-like Zn-dependent oxidoreductase
VQNLIRKPPGMSWVDAATLPVLGLSVWRMLVRRASVRVGDHVLVWGAGSGIGSFAIQVVKHFGGKVIAVTRGSSRLDYAREVGADYVIDRDHQDVEPEVARITQRRGVDLVFEHSGQATWPISVRVLRHGGAIVTCGATSGYMAETDLRFLWNRQLTFYGSHAGSKADLMEVVRRVEQGSLKPPRATVMPLRNLAEAQQIFERAEFAGKLVIIP